MSMNLCVTYQLIFFLDFNETWILSIVFRKILISYFTKPVHLKPSCVHADWQTIRRTDRHDEAYISFLQIWERAEECWGLRSSGLLNYVCVFVVDKSRPRVGLIRNGQDIQASFLDILAFEDGKGTLSRNISTNLRHTTTQKGEALSFTAAKAGSYTSDVFRSLCLKRHTCVKFFSSDIVLRMEEAKFLSRQPLRSLWT